MHLSHERERNSESAVAGGETALPVRTCIGCRQAAGRGELVRLVAGPDGSVALDTRTRIGGRGAWLHPSRACIDLAARRHAVERALGPDVKSFEPAVLCADAIRAFRRKAESLLLAARRAGHLAIGARATAEALESRRVGLVLLTHDAGREGQVLRDLAAETGLPIYTWGSREELGHVFGRAEVAITAVCDEGLGAEIVTTMNRLEGLENS